MNNLHKIIKNFTIDIVVNLDICLALILSQLRMK